MHEYAACSVEVLLPVGRDLALGAGGRLAVGVGGRGREFRAAVVELFGLRVPEPALAGLETRQERMAGFARVPRGVLARRRVAAADVPAFGAPPQVEPPAAAGQTSRTAVPARL